MKVWFENKNWFLPLVQVLSADWLAQKSLFSKLTSESEVLRNRGQKIEDKTVIKGQPRFSSSGPVPEKQISNIERWKQQQTDTEANTFEFERIKQLQG